MFISLAISVILFFDYMDYTDLYKLSYACISRYNNSILDIINNLNNNNIFLIKISETHKSNYPLYINTSKLILDKFVFDNNLINFVHDKLIYFKEYVNDEQNIIAYYVIRNKNLINILKYYNLDNKSFLKRILNNYDFDNYLNLNE